MNVSRIAPFAQLPPSGLKLDLQRYVSTGVATKTRDTAALCQGTQQVPSAVCVINARSTRGSLWKWSHGNIGHAAQILFKCWSFFDSQPPGAQRYIWPRIPPPYAYTMEWSRGVANAMNVTWATRPPSCARFWAVPAREGFPGKVESYFNRVGAAQTLAMLVLPPEARTQVEMGMRVGVNNHAIRGWQHAAEFVSHILANLPSGVVSAAEWTMTGKTLREQAALIAEHDVLIAPHGAQNANFVFVREGTVVLEMFEAAYVLPMYLALALDAGAAAAFIMVAGASTVDAAVLKTMGSKDTVGSEWSRRSQGGIQTIGMGSMIPALHAMLDARRARQGHTRHVHSQNGSVAKPEVAHVPTHGLSAWQAAQKSDMTPPRCLYCTELHDATDAAGDSCCESFEAISGYLDGGYACRSCLRAFSRLNSSAICALQPKSICRIPDLLSP